MKKVADNVRDMSNTITGRNKNKGTYALLPSEDVDNFQSLHTEERKALKQLPTMKSKSQLKQDKDLLQLQMDKFDRNLKPTIDQDVLRRFDEDLINMNPSTQNRISRTQLYELIRRDNYDGNDPIDIEHLLKERASNKIKDMIKLKQDEPRRHALEQGIKGAIIKVKAATNIQKVIRGNKTRKTLNENRQDAQAAANDLTDQF